MSTEEQQNYSVDAENANNVEKDSSTVSKRKLEETETESSTVDTSFPDSSSIEGKVSEKFPVESAGSDFKSNLANFKSRFDVSNDSATIYFQTEDDDVIAMIVADSQQELDYAKQNFLQSLDSSDHQSNKRSRTDADSITEVIRVPKSCVGLLIGKSGASLRVIEIATSTKIHVSQEDDMSGPIPMRDVTVTGLPHKIELARKEIEKAAIDPKESGATHASGPGSLTDEAIAEFKSGPSQEFTFPSAGIRHLIGKQGETIRVLQIHFQVFIHVADQGQDKDQSAPQGGDAEKAGDRVVTVYGTEENIEAVMAEINLIRKAVETGNISLMRDSELLRQTVEFSVEIQVTADVIGLIIGRRGENIKNLQSRTGTSIQVEQNSSGSSDPNLRKVTVSGRIESSVNQAVQMINETINNKGMNMGSGGPGFQHGGMGYQGHAAGMQGQGNWGQGGYNQGGNWNQQGGYRNQQGGNWNQQGGNWNQQGGNWNQQGGFRNQGGNWNQQGGYNQMQGGFNPQMNRPQGQFNQNRQNYGNNFNQGQGNFNRPYNNSMHGSHFNRSAQGQGQGQGHYQSQGQGQSGQGFGNFGGQNQQGYTGASQGQAQGQGMSSSSMSEMEALNHPSFNQLYTNFYNYYKSVPNTEDSQAQKSARHYALMQIRGISPTQDQSQ